jgi:uncharacterized protein YjiK
MGDELGRTDRRREEDRPEGAADNGSAAAVQVPVQPDPGLTNLVEKARRQGKLSKKEKRLLKDAHRPLDSWERYRALTDVLDEANDLVDLADHKARFALVIMATLNVLLFFVATRTDLVEDLPGWAHVWLAAFLLVYVLLALYFFVQAIESLRPRQAQPQVSNPSDLGLDEHPLGLRFYEDILGRDVQDYRGAWRDLRIGQLNNELAVQAHALAQINHAKYSALRRLYMGLKVLTIMAVVLVALAGLANVVGTAKAGKSGRKNAQVLGTPSRHATPDVKEPSGVAFDAARSHFFVVGDEGSLVEYDTSANVVARHAAVKGNLEDVAVHPPSGLVIVLDEKESLLLAYDPNAQQVRKRWRLDRKGLLGQQPGDANNGFEGLAFREEAGRPGGGLFYLVHQRDPAMVVSITLDVNGADGAVGEQAVVERWPLPGHGDLTAATFMPTLQELLVVADKEDQLLVLRLDGTLASALPLPGLQQEGIAFDSTGTLWVADDQDKSLLWMDGALDAIGKFQREPASFQDPLSDLDPTAKKK